MKITRLEIIKVPPSWTWLRIHTDTEIVGWGEPYLENRSDSVIAEVKRLEPLLIGKDPTQVEKLWKLMYESGSGYVGGPTTMSAISGIDIALWDIAGKAAGLPIYKMLGGATSERIKVYRQSAGYAPVSVTPGEPLVPEKPAADGFAEKSPESYRESARILVQDWGYRTLKIHLGVGDGIEAISDIDRVVELFLAAQEGAGSGVDVAIDLHNPNPAIGKQLIQALAPYRPYFIEEPMPVERVDALEQIVSGTSATIAGGERWMGKWIFFDAVSTGSLTVLQPDICHAGGITECKKIASIGEATYAKLALHCPLSPLAFAAAIQVDACTTNFLVQEHHEVNDSRVDGKTVIGSGFFNNPFELGEDGCVGLPEGPGLGLDIGGPIFEEIMSKTWSPIRS